MGSRSFSRIAVRVLALAATVLLLSGCSDEPTAPGSSSTPLTIQAAIGTDPGTGASLETDKDDYLPGDSVRIVGQGWAPGETVQLHLTRDPQTSEDNDWAVAADELGGFATGFLVVDTDFGVTFELTGTGPVSGSVVIVMFTDGRSVEAATINGATPPPAVVVAPSASIAMVVTGKTTCTGGGPGNVNCEGDPTPSESDNWESTLVEFEPVAGGTSILRCNNGVSIGKPTPTSGTNHSFSVTGPGTAGTYTVKFRIFSLDDCDGDGSGAKTYGSGLIVSAPSDDDPPVVTNVQASPNPTNGTVNVVLTATATDAASAIASAEYNIDGGSFSAMAASDGAFDELAEDVTVTIPAATIAALADGNHTLCVRATDTQGNASADDTACTTLLVDKAGPVITNVQASPNPTNGTVAVVLTGTATDALTNVVSAEYRIGAGSYSPMSASDGAFDELAEDVTVTIPAASFAALADGTHSLCIRATDAVSNLGTAVCTTLVLDRTPPAISNFTVSPNPVAVNTSFTISATFTDALTNVTGAEYSLGGTGGTWIALPSAAGTSPYGDSQTENGTITLTLSSADVLDVCVRSTDQVGNTNQATGTNPIQCVLLAVYDPSAGFVTGGGWIDSPEGACNWADCQYTTVGKATFGFVSKYHKGANIPTGNTEFQFRAGNLNFASTSYDWLVVSQGGSRAQYKGYGTINGQAGYGFLLTALDETPDKFRIKIWSTSTNAVVYDNRMGDADSGDTGTVLGGGSIIIHVPKK